MPHPCFWLTPTRTARRWLRRYASPSTCTVEGNYYHEALIPIEDGQIVSLPDDPVLYTVEPEHVARDDPRWPTTCPCGYVFSETDQWQVFDRPLYQRADTGELVTLSDAPIGAMWESNWLASMGVGPDGRCLSVMTPGGQWNIDLPSSSGGRWTRTGEPPLLTARPSILIRGRYHGWLNAGELSDDLDRR